MPTIPDKCEFEVEADLIELKTRTNGDHIEIHKINLNQAQAASLAYLINHPNHLKIEIKIA